jgi:hypothetical protein
MPPFRQQPRRNEAVAPIVPGARDNDDPASLQPIAHGVRDGAACRFHERKSGYAARHCEPVGIAHLRAGEQFDHRGKGSCGTASLQTSELTKIAPTARLKTRQAAFYLGNRTGASCYRATNFVTNALI